MYRPRHKKRFETRYVVAKDYYRDGDNMRDDFPVLYVATVGDYDLDCTYGQGRTPLDAIVDLLDQIEEG